MALHFSANQYDQAFDPHFLQNWEVPSEYRPRPRAFDGFTQIIANDRGHLLTGVKRARDSPWGTFVGTWDMPLQVPAPPSKGKTGLKVAWAEKPSKYSSQVVQPKYRSHVVPRKGNKGYMYQVLQPDHTSQDVQPKYYTSHAVEPEYYSQAVQPKYYTSHVVEPEYYSQAVQPNYNAQLVEPEYYSHLQPEYSSHIVQQIERPWTAFSVRDRVTSRTTVSVNHRTDVHTVLEHAYGNTMTNTCARDEFAIQKLERIKTDGEIVLSGKLKQCKVPSPLPIKADVHADKYMGTGTVIAPADSGYRSGARAPEPNDYTVIRSPPPVQYYTEKPGTPMSPNLVWPKPASRAGSRVKSATPRLMSKPQTPQQRQMAQQVMASPFHSATPKAFTPVPPKGTSPILYAASQKPGTPAGGGARATPSRTSINWPAPRSVEPPRHC